MSPDFQYPGRAEAEQYWATVRTMNAEGKPVPSRPPSTLAEQAGRRIAALEREIAEWQTIKGVAEERGVKP